MAIRIGGTPYGPFTYHADPYTKTDAIGEPWNDHLPPSECEDQSLHESEQGFTRLVLRTRTFPPGEKHDGDHFKGELFYQKKSAGEDWIDPSEYTTMQNIRRGECIKLNLKASHLRSIFQSLAIRYSELEGIGPILSEVGLSIFDPSDATLISGSEKELLSNLVANNPDFWDHMREFQDLEIPSVVLKEQTRQKQRAAVEQFERHLNDGSWGELTWSKFFQNNEWIFGLGLHYEYLEPVQPEAYVGGRGINRRGGNQVDSFRRTAGNHSFTAFVEIKKPDTLLLGKQPYRDPNIFNASKELIGGISQIQHYCDTYTTNEGTSGRTEEQVGAENYQPKGLLIVGNLSQLETRDQRQTFELLRRQITNPEVVTFDELLARAKYIVDHDGQVGGPIEEPKEDDLDQDPFAVPF